MLLTSGSTLDSLYKVPHQMQFKQIVLKFQMKANQRYYCDLVHTMTIRVQMASSYSIQRAYQKNQKTHSWLSGAIQPTIHFIAKEGQGPQMSLKPGLPQGTPT